MIMAVRFAAAEVCTHPNLNPGSLTMKPDTTGIEMWWAARMAVWADRPLNDKLMLNEWHDAGTFKGI